MYMLPARCLLGHTRSALLLFQSLVGGCASSVWARCLKVRNRAAGACLPLCSAIATNYDACHQGLPGSTIPPPIRTRYGPAEGRVDSLSFLPLLRASSTSQLSGCPLPQASPGPCAARTVPGPPRSPPAGPPAQLCAAARWASLSRRAGPVAQAAIDISL